MLSARNITKSPCRDSGSEEEKSTCKAGLVLEGSEDKAFSEGQNKTPAALVAHEALCYLTSADFPDLIVYHSPLPTVLWPHSAPFFPSDLIELIPVPWPLHVTVPCLEPPYPRSLYRWLLIFHLSADTMSSVRLSLPPTPKESHFYPNVLSV